MSARTAQTFIAQAAASPDGELVRPTVDGWTSSERHWPDLSQSQSLR